MSSALKRALEQGKRDRDAETARSRLIDAAYRTALIDAACEAEELFDIDELERFAEARRREEQHRLGNNPQFSHLGKIADPLPSELPGETDEK